MRDVADRESVLVDRVDRPPAPPLVGYLHDVERRTAVDVTTEATRVLDVASAAAVTSGLSADRVDRVDFSAAASDHAGDLLSDRVASFATVSPGDPVLPFSDETFDAAVCVGPYDWRFLAVETLTEEIRRVLAPSGTFAVTMPTPRSPYASRARNRLRYYPPAAALELLSPAWTLSECRPIYQFPGPLHRVFASLPGRLQEPFVGIAARASDSLHRRENLSGASYLALSCTPADDEQRLSAALEALFRPVAWNGFWDEERGSFLRALRYEQSEDGTLTWSPERRTEWRYGPFALMGAMRWRTADAGSDAYDTRLRSALSYFATQVEEEGRADVMPSFGIGPLIAAFSMAADVFDGPHLRRARWLWRSTAHRFDFDHGEDSLVLYGWAHLADRMDETALDDAIEDAVWTVTERQDPRTGLFHFDTPTTRRHQNQMYTCWGLAKAVESTGLTGYLSNVGRALQDALDRRMREDGAFVWEDVGFRQRALTRAYYVVSGDREAPYWRLLFPCHQSFFVVAADHYRRAGGRRSFARPCREAMEWIERDNPRGADLAAESGLGVPLRFVTVDGRIDVDDQQFKGSYEVGAYVMALSALMEWGRTGAGTEPSVDADARSRVR